MDGSVRDFAPSSSSGSKKQALPLAIFKPMSRPVNIPETSRYNEQGKHAPLVTQAPYSAALLIQFRIRIL
jgi:hypothetical protein